MKGVICLDIDGTITDHAVEVPEVVVSYFKKLSLEGWRFLFITGRSFTWATVLTEIFEFPYLLATQNGADLIEMPEKRSLRKEYLTVESLSMVLKATDEVDALLYAPWQMGDFCYLNFEKLSPKVKWIVEKLQDRSKDPWIDVRFLEPNLEIPLVKVIGFSDRMEELRSRLNVNESIYSVCVREPFFNNQMTLNLISSCKATKGEVIKYLRSYFPNSYWIAAGDDHNDVSMFDQVDYAIAMETAPKEVLDCADFIAPSAAKCGIITALERSLSVGPTR